MLTVFILWVYVTTLLYSYGVLTVKCMDTFLDAPPEKTLPSFSIITISGLCTLSVFAGLFSLFTNVGLLAHLFVLVGGIVHIAYARHFFISRIRAYWKAAQKQSWGTLFLFCAPFCIMLLITSVTPVMHGDTGLYHAQSVKWLEEYGTIPGLANIHGRFAFNTSWHYPAALFSLSFLKMQPFLVLNGLFFILCTLFALEGMTKLMQGNRNIHNICKAALYPILILFFLLNKQYIVFFNSLSPDFQSTFFVLIIFCLFTKMIQQNTIATNTFGRDAAIVMYFSLCVLTIKLSTAPILLLPAVLILKKRTHILTKEILFITGLSLVSLFPWMMRYYLLSGYLIYPFPGIDIFNPDWKVSLFSVIHEKKAVESWARLQETDLHKVLSMPFTDWFPLWFRNLQLIDKGLALSIAILSLWHLLRAGLKTTIESHSRKIITEYAILYVAAYAGVLFWFCTAPDFRFGYGFLLFLAILLLLPLTCQMEKLIFFLQKSYKPLGLVTLLFIGFEGRKIYTAYQNSEALQKLFTVDMIQKRLILPSNYPKAEIKKMPMKNFTVLVPTLSGKSLCWNSSLPCTPYPNKRVALRGITMKNGFRQVPD